ncbi:hypothetical protein BDK88_3435 [Natrinema hispanicum]|uniref:Uncharacterized protein n=1 Tax=Natrinema hispanicum TaxID=392421 RepID=A0A482YC29_9EURY|nr:hypothetical protein BDK88_3435 [Natrinema hispanicum]
MSEITDTVSESLSVSGVATEQHDETTSMYVDDMDGLTPP